MKKQLSIFAITTTLMLTTTGSYAFNGNGSKGCERNNRGHWSYNQHHMSHVVDRSHQFKKPNMNLADKITLKEFMALKKTKFSQMDTNGDGALTQNEMMNYRQNRYNTNRRF